MSLKRQFFKQAKFVKSYQQYNRDRLGHPCISVDDVTAFCLYLVKKLQENLIKIRSSGMLGGLTGLTSVLVVLYL